MPSTRSRSRPHNAFEALASDVDTGLNPAAPSMASLASDLPTHDPPPHLGAVHDPSPHLGPKNSLDIPTRARGHRSTRSVSPDAEHMSTLERILAGQNAHMADITNLNRTMLESVREWMSRMVATQTRPTLNPTALKIRMADPDQFDGSPRMTESFINSCVNIFMAQPLLYTSVESRVRFALSFMKGDSLHWHDARFKEIKEGTYIFTTWDDFEDQLRDSFGNPHLVEDAQRKLHTIEQGRRNAEDFFIEFEDLKAEAGFNDAAVIFELKRALRKDVRDETNRQIPKAAVGMVTSYRDWKDMVLRVDKDLRGSAADNTFFAGPTVNRRFSPAFPFSQRQPLSSTSTVNAPNASSSATTAATTNRPRLPGSMPAIATCSFPTSSSGSSASSSASGKQSTRNQGCYGCGDLDHQWRNCKKTKFGDKARVLLERVDEVDAVVESLRKVMEDTSLDEEADCDTEIFARIATEYPLFFVESDE